MSDEKQPLLPGPSSRRRSSAKIVVKQIVSKIEEDGSDESLSIKLGSVKIPMYGSNTGAITKVIPIDERVTYSWCDINAFATSSETSRRKYWCCGPKTVVTGSQKKHILKNVTGIAYPGELLAVLGTSGSGKTTLLNALTFRTTKDVAVTGIRCVNGVPATLKSLASTSAYVQQNDLFIGTLTVKEHLVFQAMVRMDRHISYQDRMRRVEEVLIELSLKKCENTQIGYPSRDSSGISGGEKKRLSFAAEVLTNPSAMFCDEPTSGLDSFMALNVVQVLKGMANSGKTVICTIHQPSSELYAMFDKVLFLAEGRLAYLGTPEEADIFFAELEAPCPKNFNPADYYIQLLAVLPGREESCKQAINMISNKFEKSDIGVRMLVEAKTKCKDYESTESDVYFGSESQKSPYKASWCSQFCAVLWRSWLSIIKDPMLVKVRLFQTLVISLIVGAIYYGQVLDENGVMNINGALFLFLTNMTFQNVFAVIHVFSSELPVFLRENKNGMYRTDVYFLSKVIAETPLFIVLPVLFTSICYYMIGLNPSWVRFFIACGIVTLVANVSTSFGYMVSCLSGKTSLALSLGSPLIIPFLLFGGFFLNVNSIPVYFEWVSYFSWFRYGNEALMINQWSNVTRIDCRNSPACPPNGHVILQMFNFSEMHFIWDILSLAFLIAFFRLAAFLALLWRAYK
ncbi:unnamed protein product [Callosobruchus maculatus]|uniref:Protein white n=1 Tax=Callosobruchus maculatus TaxID=64391 RepID=A0A653CWP2_CALMS|nr:unnamed protein product [Callosobruchus maculatus]